MSVQIPRGKSDDTIERIIVSLKTYQGGHPDSAIDIYRQNPVSVRIRIVDRSFSGRTKVERSREVWKSLNSLSDDDQSDISTLILLTPEEAKSSFANLEFDDPVPSTLFPTEDAESPNSVPSPR